MSQLGDDCYFFYYSSCSKGLNCPFRHSTPALGTETVCHLWRQERCHRPDCPFRHMESQKDRSTIACYWETQPGGCTKAHCVFRHNISQPGAGVCTPEIKSVIGAVKEDEKDVDQIQQGDNTIAAKKTPNRSIFSRVGVTADLDLEGEDTPSPKVEPVVVNFDEESDCEGTTLSPVKDLRLEEIEVKSKIISLRKNIDKEQGETVNLGVKTLDELRRAKILGKSNEPTDKEETASTELDQNNVQLTRGRGVAGRLTSSDVPTVKSLAAIRREKLLKGELKSSVEEKDDKKIDVIKIKTLEEIKRDKTGNLVDRDGGQGVAVQNSPRKRVNRYQVYRPPTKRNTDNENADGSGTKKLSDGESKTVMSTEGKEASNGDQVRVKTFEEIMTEKRKRKQEWVLQTTTNKCPQAVEQTGDEVPTKSADVQSKKSELRKVPVDAKRPQDAPRVQDNLYTLNAPPVKLRKLAIKGKSSENKTRSDLAEKQPLSTPRSTNGDSVNQPVDTGKEPEAAAEVITKKRDSLTDDFESLLEDIDTQTVDHMEEDSSKNEEDLFREMEDLLS